MTGTWLIAFIALYFLSLRQLSGQEFLLRFWRNEFLPLPPHSMADLGWFPHAFFALLEIPVGLTSPVIPLGGIAALALLIGVFRLGSRRPYALTTLLLPIAFTALASALHKYPFGGRLLLFAAPPLVFLIAAGTEQVLSRTWGHFRLLGVAFATLLFVAPVAGSAGRLLMRLQDEPVKHLVADLRQLYRDGDVILVSCMGLPGYQYYAPQQGLPTVLPEVSGPHRTGVPNFLRCVEPLLGRRRVWVMLAERADVNEILHERLEQLGTCRATFPGPNGGTLMLYDLGRTTNESQQQQQ